MDLFFSLPLYFFLLSRPCATMLLYTIRLPEWNSFNTFCVLLVYPLEQQRRQRYPRKRVIGRLQQLADISREKLLQCGTCNPECYTHRISRQRPALLPKRKTFIKPGKRQQQQPKKHTTLQVEVVFYSLSGRVRLVPGAIGKFITFS